MSNTKNRAVLLSFCVAGLLILSTSGELIPIGNGGFEQPVIPAGAFETTSAPPNWTPFGSLNFVGRTIGVLNPDTTALYTNGAPEGQNVGVIFLLPANTGNPAGMMQTLATNLEARTHYSLTLEIGNIATNNVFDFSDFPGYQVELLAGTNVVAIDNNSLLPPEGDFLTTTVEVFTTSNPIGLDEALTIRLTNLGGPGIEVNFDNLLLESTPIPLPTISIEHQTNGQLQIQFSNIIEASTTLTNWIQITPQPPSPYTFTPTNEHRYYRAIAE